MPEIRLNRFRNRDTFRPSCSSDVVYRLHSSKRQRALVMALPQPTSSTLVEQQVLDIVAGLVAELAGGAVRRPALDDSLDRDLGISSLERVELLLRLEHTSGVRLPDSVMAEATTPKELIAAILRATPAGAAEAPRGEAPQGPDAAGDILPPAREPGQQHFPGQ